MIIGIGCAKDIDKVFQSAEKASKTLGTDVLCYCNADADFADLKSKSVMFRCSENPCRALVDDLKSGRIDGAVRGTLAANETMRYIKEVYGVERIERVALLETADGIRFLLAPVGVDEGWTVEEKIALIYDARRIASLCGISQETAVLSGGRIGDIGRHKIVDKTIADAIEAAYITGSKHSEILIEDAVKSCGIVIPPDGISGNLIFRTLTFLGRGKGLGAPILNIPDVFVDTSRASGDYFDAVSFAVSMSRGSAD